MERFAFRSEKKLHKSLCILGGYCFNTVFQPFSLEGIIIQRFSFLRLIHYCPQRTKIVLLAGKPLTVPTIPIKMDVGQGQKYFR